MQSGPQKFTRNAVLWLANQFLWIHVFLTYLYPSWLLLLNRMMINQCPWSNHEAYVPSSPGPEHKNTITHRPFSKYLGLQNPFLNMFMMRKDISLQRWLHSWMWYKSYARVLHCLCHTLGTNHYCDVIMGRIASQITSLTSVYSIVYSEADQRKHQSSASLAFVRGIHRWPVNSPHKWPVARKMFPFDDAIIFWIEFITTMQSTGNDWPPWYWQILSILFDTGRGRCTETCGLDYTFSP